MRYCRCEGVREGNDMRSLAYTAVLLPTWRAVVESGGVGVSGHLPAALISSTLPDTTTVDCFISRFSSTLQIPQMRSNHMPEGFDG